jgi:TonB family protein
VKSGVVDTSAKPPVVPSYVPSFVPNAPNCLLTYPRSGVVMELEGTVKVKFDVGDDGRLHHSTIVQSSGYQALDDATLGSMDRCAFRAAVRDGTSIPASFDAMFVWKLE